MKTTKRVNIGTCSWKCDSWKWLIYPEDQNDFNYLSKYSQRSNTVEIDQWFWSLFKGDKVSLPQPIVGSKKSPIKRPLKLPILTFNNSHGLLKFVLLSLIILLDKINNWKDGPSHR